MKKTTINIFAFSLAEALITLLIVALISLATIPVITKKARKEENHGKWICTLNSAGQHIQWNTGASGDANNPTTWAVSGNSCTFQVPSGARNFAITAVAGGGGGAGAQYQNKSWTSDFAVNYYGKYKAVAIGGGGQGGKNKDCGRGGGGGAGGVGYAEFTLDENTTQIKITKGAGGDSDKWNGSKGGSSIISKVYRNTTTGNTQTYTIIEAKGGDGGGGRYGWGCPNGSGAGGAQGSLVGSYTKSFNSSLGTGVSHCDREHCFGYTKVTVQESINKLIAPYQIFQTKNSVGGYVGDYYISQIGRGGDPTSARGYYPRTGQNGAAIVTTEIYWAGGAGKAGNYKIRDFYPSFDKKKLTITVGKGGKGGNAGTSSGGYATKGSDGGATVIDDLYGLPGGKGGELKYQEKAYSNTSGEDGEKTPLYYKNEPVLGYGGLSGTNSNVNGMTSAGYGAGGGGGGIKPGSSSGTASAGKGGDGAPGYVLIEW